jgi:hypothetical protein
MEIYINFNAAGTFLEKVGRTEKQSLHGLRVLSTKGENESIR